MSPGTWELLLFLLVLMNRLPSLPFSYIVGSLYFWGIHFSRLFRGCGSCRCAAWGWLNFSLYINIVLIFFHILVFQEYCALIESRIPLRPGLWAWGLLRLPLILKNRINKIESAVYLYCRFSLFPDYLWYCLLTMPQYFHRMKLNYLLSQLYNVADSYFCRDINVF